MRNLFFVLAALGLASCGRANDAATDKNLLLTNDFESLEHWLPSDQTAALTHAQAHSGRTALLVDSTHEYSLTYSKPLGHFQLKLPARLRVSAWVWLPNAQATATLVTAVTDPARPEARPLLWEGLKINDKVRSYGRWAEVNQLVTLPAGLADSYKLSFYLWRTSPGTVAYLDDVRVTQEP